VGSGGSVPASKECEGCGEKRLAICSECGCGFCCCDCEEVEDAGDFDEDELGLDPEEDLHG
jgi:hypothetical protein